MSHSITRLTKNRMDNERKGKVERISECVTGVSWLMDDKVNRYG